MIANLVYIKLPYSHGRLRLIAASVVCIARARGAQMVDVVRVNPGEQARRRPFPEGVSFFNLKEKFCCRLAADAAGRHMMDNDKLLYPQVIPGSL